VSGHKPGHSRRHEHHDEPHDHAAGAHFHPESINPALEGARFCPRCGATPEIDFPRSLQCPVCGYAAFFNPKPVACAIPREPDGRVWLLRRGFEPSAGLWTFPGGFVDLGESVEQAAVREAQEELEIEVRLTGLVGVYSRPQDRVVLVVFDAVPLGTPRPTPEAPAVQAFAPADVPWDELAFWSTEQALRDVLDGRTTRA
jgi:ADP-ribose pyrophosphatase YjhB (NUDIX family)